MVLKKHTYRTNEILDVLELMFGHVNSNGVTIMFINSSFDRKLHSAHTCYLHVTAFPCLSPRSSLTMMR